MAKLWDLPRCRPIPTHPAAKTTIVTATIGRIRCEISMVHMHIPILVIATRNAGKLREFRSLLAPSGLKVMGLADVSIEGDCEEEGQSFADNARQKALFYSCDTHLPVLADDSGLEVFSLGGRPGIYSARYAGPEAPDSDRIDKLLAELDATGGDRSARFVCALALAQGNRILIETEGECRGVIAQSPRGKNGFGYDPVFLFPKLNRTYAELGQGEKNLHSHRGRAVRKLLEKLR